MRNTEALFSTDAFTAKTTRMQNEQLIRKTETAKATLPARKPAPFLQLAEACEPRDSVASQSAAAHSRRRTTTVPSRPATTGAHWLARDPDSSDLVNVPFAFTTSMILITGLTMSGCGIVGTSVWLAVVGFLLTLAGSALYGRSLYDARS
jgi:hypothetical protein